MPAVKQIYIAVIGTGNVGRHVLTQLSYLRQTHPGITVVLITRTTRSLRPPHPRTHIPLSTWETDLESSTYPAPTVPETLHLLSTLPFPSVLIDATSSQALADAYPSLLQRGISVVTPNKKAFSGALSLWHGVQEARRRPGAPERGMLYHEATVGAGLPVVSTLTDLLATGDTVRRIEGVFSGTLSYLFNNFAPATASVSSGDAKNANPSWSACVASAKAAGYTEPDPRDDLNGMDVARKVVILARLAGMEVEGTESFPVQSLIPEELGGVGSGEEFMARLHECDAGMEEVREGAAREGMVVRYVGRVDVAGGALRVGVERVGRGHALAGLEGSDNVVGFWTERYGERPLVVQGAGAGGAVTAMGVTADLIKVIERVS